MKKLFSFILCLIFANPIESQNTFLSLFDDPKPLHSVDLGPTISINYFERDILQEGVKTIDLTSSDIESNNMILLTAKLNQYPKLKFLKLRHTGPLFQKEYRTQQLFELSKLHHIECIYLYGPWNMDYDFFWEELSEMPNLKYLILEQTSVNLSWSKGAQSMIEKLSGIALIRVKLIPDNSEVRIGGIKELLLVQDKYSKLNIINQFRNFTELEGLHINADSLSTQDLQYLNKYTQLAKLTLVAQKFESKIPISEMFSNLTNLVNLRIANFSKEQIAGISEFQNLKELHLISRNLTEFPTEVFQLQNLKSFSFSNHALTKLPNEIKVFKGIENLNFSRNKLIHIPKEIGALQNLRTIDLSSNDLVVLPSEIEHLKKLQRLNLTDNRLEYLPNTICKLKNLEVLEAERNDILSLPHQFGKLQNLKQLILNLNLISTIPNSFSKLENLEKWQMANNRLTNLPSKLGNMSALKEMIFYNSDSWYEFMAKDGHPKRSENQIENLPNSFPQLAHLQFAHLSNNPISDNSIPLVLRTRSPNLKLNLTSCNVKILPTSGWSEARFESLILRSNPISSIPSEVFRTKIKDIDISSTIANAGLRSDSPTKLILSGFEKGIFSKEELMEQENILEAIMDMCSNIYSREKKDILLKYYPIAFEIDSQKALSLIHHENYAIALFRNGQYEKSIPHYTEAISKRESDALSVINFIAPLYSDRSDAYLNIGDTLNAAIDLAHLHDRYSLGTAGTASILYASISKYDKSEEYFKKAENHYNYEIEKKDRERVWAYKLSLLEQYLVSEKVSKFDYYASLLSVEGIPEVKYQIIFKYLNILRNFNLIDLNQSFSELDEVVKFKNFKNDFWSCDLVELWASKFSQTKKEKINQFTELICSE